MYLDLCICNQYLCDADARYELNYTNLISVATTSQILLFGPVFTRMHKIIAQQKAANKM